MLYLFFPESSYIYYASYAQQTTNQHKPNKRNKSRKATTVTPSAAKAAANAAADTEIFEVKGEDGHRKKIPIRNSIYRLIKPVDEWPENRATPFWCLGVAMGGGQKADSYPLMSRQTIMEKLKMFYTITGQNHNSPYARRNEIHAAVNLLVEEGIIEECELERYLDTSRIKGWKPGANDVVVSIEDEFKTPTRRYL